MSGTISITLFPAVGEAPIEDASHQAAQWVLFQALGQANIKVNPKVIVRKSTGPEGGWQFFGEYLIPLTETIAPILGVAFGAWLQERAGRKVKLKIGDIEVEARTPTEIDALLQKIKSFRQEDQDKNNNNNDKGA